MLAVLAFAGFALAPPADAAEQGGEPPYPHGSFVEDCGLCHGAQGWRPARPGPGFDHAKYFRLEGAHKTAACNGCHKSLKFDEEKTRQGCVACHGDVHIGEFGADCARCHTAVSFIDQARMRRAHVLTRFPLVGAHYSADCDTCHPPQAQGHLRYVNTRTDCAACHLDDYLGTTNPNHQAAGLSQDCTGCHFQTTWLPARFPGHDSLYFPISTGTHRGKWLYCSECHYQPGSYAIFSCILCHAHSDPAPLASRHAGVNGYQYTNTSCYNCHPNGQADD
jgi:hypothetical protein